MRGLANTSLRIRRISPGQVQILQTLWSAQLRRAGKRPRPERSREARLRRIAEIVGREVQSSKDLTWREANRVIHRWLEEARTPDASAGTEPGAAAGESVPEIPDRPTEAQLWKIHQIEQYIGWNGPRRQEQRLSGFLQKKFYVDSPEQLRHDQAWRAIEALCAVGARERIRARKGKTYAVKPAELTREVAALKQELQDRRPSQL